VRGQCYVQYFRRFLPIFDKNIVVFLKSYFLITFFQKDIENSA
jgi:hypothetical protein